MLASSPHVWDLIAEWVEWDARKTARGSSHEIANMASWRLKANAPTYREVERRRNEFVEPDWAKSGNEMLRRRRESAA